MWPKWLPLAFAAPCLGGCLQVCYLAQAAAGQDDIAFRARPVADVVADERVASGTRGMLTLVEDVKRYGEEHGLTATASYREYADLGREAVVWVVTASHPLRFEAVTWRFPIVGEVPYLGWFDRGDAERLAATLAAEGRDVFVREARAYSTLGWFDDPVLSTMLADGPDELVEVVLHESTHATHYVPSQTVFNESLADFVASRLTTAYLRERQRADRFRLHDHAEREHAHERRLRALRSAHDRLERLYASAATDAAKLAEKARVLEALQRELGSERALNNAALLQAQAYHSGAAGFERLLAACGNRWPRFLAAVKAIGPAAFREVDQAALDGLLEERAQRGCEGG